MGFVSDLLAKLLKKQVKEHTAGAVEHVASSAGVEVSVETDDDDDESEVALEVEGDAGEEKDVWGPFEELAKSKTAQSFEEFWYQIHRIEEAGAKGDEQLQAALSAKGIRDNLHLQQIRDTFQRHFGHLHEFHQAIFNARGRQGKEDLQQVASKYPGLFSPIDGVDLKTFATIQARMMQSGSAGPDAVRGILSSYNLTQEKWDVVNAQWLARMSDQTDNMATIALNGEYGKYFAEAGQGQYGAAAQAAAPHIGMKGEAGGPAAGTAPCTLERYAEIAAAQEVWHERGLDITEMLQKTFGMTIMDWSNLSAWWSAELQKDYRVSLRLYNELVPMYKKKMQAS